MRKIKSFGQFTFYLVTWYDLYIIWKNSAFKAFFISDSKSGFVEQFIIYTGHKFTIESFLIFEFSFFAFVLLLPKRFSYVPLLTLKSFYRLYPFLPKSTCFVVPFSIPLATWLPFLWFVPIFKKRYCFFILFYTYNHTEDLYHLT